MHTYSSVRSKSKQLLETYKRMVLETVTHSSVQHVILYRWLPSLDTCLTRVMKATDTCSSARNVRELHRDLRDWNTKVKATGSFPGSEM